MYKSVVYEGDKVLGEVEVYPQNQNGGSFFLEKEIRISHFSQQSERCPPLAVLHTVTSSSPGVCFKMEANLQSPQDSSLLNLLHSSCIRDNKTAVVSLTGEELHLVAMPSRKNDGRCLCFWGFKVAFGLYNSCLVMLNLRCLGIVFDLDETLIVANTMRSFEDRIEALQRKLNSEADPQRISGILSEVKRYQEDKIILKQYAENDQVVDNGKVIKSQSEVVPALAANYQSIVRPLIRLQDKNIILTRINPLIRDTSVLVRLRPAWEDLRSYLTARGRKRFEVYVCTMAERDYALEMWRLLDPDSNLINSKELLNRIVCVKAGLRKSLFNVFQDGICHPKMALVIDDRLKVWDEKDQPRVHVVPAFAPYYAPQAEANNAVPVLCVARNVACNVRGGFFKDFDEGMLQQISEVMYEDDIKDIPSPPDVSNYLVSEDDGSTLNANKDPLTFDGMADAEVERILKESISAIPTAVANLDPRFSPLPYTVAASSISVPPSTFQGSSPFGSIQLQQVIPVVKPLIQVRPPEASLQSSPAREEGEVPESELDPDTRRRLLILQHGQDTRDHPLGEPQFPGRPPLQVSVPRVQARGNWFPMEEEMSPRLLTKEFPMNSEAMHIEKHRPHHPPFVQKMESSISSDRVLENQRLPKEALQREDRLRMNHSLSTYHSFSGEDVPLGRSPSSRDLDVELGRVDLYAETPAGALQDIAIKCGTKVEFRSALASSVDLQFSVEVLFAGEKIGEGIGRTRREAQHQAAEGSLMNLADKYMSRLKSDSGSVHGEGSWFSSANDNGFISAVGSFGYQRLPKEQSPSLSNASDSSRVLDPRLEGSKKSIGSVSDLEELVEVDGQVLGKGIGLTWDEAKMQAAENGLRSLRSMPSQFSQKRHASPRAVQGMSNKRSKPEYSRVMQRMPSFARYPRNASVP
ncbi:RNA polymerase II C-terminal domain phosphatase-like 1 isoform X2 [Rhododendron vialii]|uniref:RNA polymerase II C-terminal domain phosphatase-like 1 isoform X2 n=1 Tax=Rhododendron vialii TaxID=182163 RepID=UPI00265EA92B|nr:RNA polymerase II C-terminal domain phosphatase-like 1 isoform X2 [Rhododendron vialii]